MSGVMTSPMSAYSQAEYEALHASFDIATMSTSCKIDGG
eukprot:CAMPEP_0178936772 /NCGR_PEP_ID=MMETSP0786-20121207/25370_1 /TAXON_ID=186022 /ORGANISM="Thalassionema frauenfeldii, Strain CCMP 1798" /LENGTH=38 /DNA_ID= /DNA_START= /DNA_END= /DNA_ORIENTATION=